MHGYRLKLYNVERSSKNYSPNTFQKINAYIDSIDNIAVLVIAINCGTGNCNKPKVIGMKKSSRRA